MGQDIFCRFIIIIEMIIIFELFLLYRVCFHRVGRVGRYQFFIFTDCQIHSWLSVRSNCILFSRFFFMCIF